MFNAQKIHMIGIGGIGMSALAKLFLINGKQITGSDLHASDITRDLQKRGVIFNEGHNASFFPTETELVVYSPAVQNSNVEFERALELGIPLLSYADALGELSKQYSTIVVTGTHGKSTTTAMLGLILSEAGYDPTVILGSLVPSFEYGNLRVGKSRFLVIEGCEHQANMLKLHPEIIVLTNIEADHLDFYKTLENVKQTFQKFVDQLGSNGLVVVNADDSVSRELKIQNPIQYNSSSDIFKNLKLQVPGVFNRYNATAATTAAMELGVPFEICQKTLEKFTGIWRRFERVGTWNNCEVISDYGHHPTAIRVTLSAAREIFPNKKIILCFQPHQHSRTEMLFDDFVDALSLADALVLPEIYRVEGRTEDETVSSKHLVEKIQERDFNFPVHFAEDFEEAEKKLKTLIQTVPDAVIIFQGAGNVDDLARRLTKMT
ncbi:UDP-N-acetylmuramate--L-alanine ligase [Candidatus Uhrbacteria bacterium]|nr:UDP-N-acetylmuramate--L-alanine ligase [Candidatus Uhrbacteria bacterium]